VNINFQQEIQSIENIFPYYSFVVPPIIILSFLMSPIIYSDLTILINILFVKNSLEFSNNFFDLMFEVIEVLISLD